MKNLRGLSILTILLLTVWGIGCSGSGSNPSTVASLNAVGDVLDDVSDVIPTIQTGDRSEAPVINPSVSLPKFNFYPDATDSDVYNGTTKVGDSSFFDGKTLDQLKDVTYNFTNVDGDKCFLSISNPDSDGYFQLTYITEPASSIEVAFTTETIYSKDGANTWDPYNKTNGQVDFKARDPYKVYYFDGRVETRKVLETSANNTEKNLVFSDVISLSDTALTKITTPAGEDYYSVTELTMNFPNIIAQIFLGSGTGKEWYSEDKDASGNVLKSVTKSIFDYETGLFNIPYMAERYYTINQNDVATTYSLVENKIGNILKIYQKVGKLVKNVSVSPNTLKGEYVIFFDNNGLLGANANNSKFWIKQIDLSGNSDLMSGDITITKKFKEKPKAKMFDDLLPFNPQTDSVTPIIDDLDYVIANDATKVFDHEYVFHVTSGTVPSRYITFSAEKVPCLDKFLDAIVNYDVTITYYINKKTIDISLTSADGYDITITGAKVSGNNISGQVTIDGGATTDFSMSVNGSGKIKVDGEWQEVSN